MRANKILPIIMLLLLVSITSQAQESEIKADGIVIPTMSANPSSPTQGQMIYYVSGGTKEYRYYDGTQWLALAAGSSGTVTNKIVDNGNGDGKVEVLDAVFDAITFDLNGKQKMNLFNNVNDNAKLLLDGDIQMFDGNGKIEFWEFGKIRAQLDYDSGKLRLLNNESDGIDIKTEGGDLNLETTGDDIFLNSGDDILFRSGGITKAVMKDNGDIAIGSTIPLARLDIRHTDGSSSDPELRVVASNSLNRIRLSSGGSTNQYWDLMSASLGSTSQKDFTFRYKTNSLTNDVFTISGEDRRIGINATNPNETLRVIAEEGDDPLRVQYDPVGSGFATTKLMVHDNGAVSIGSATKPEESDTSLEITDHMRLIPVNSENCDDLGDVGKIYYDLDADKLKVCVKDDNPFATGNQTNWVDLH